MSSKHEKERVRAVIYAAFEAGKNRNFGVLERIHAQEDFSKFGDTPPYDIMNLQDALTLEEMGFASISGYDYEINDLKISVLDRVAISTFLLSYNGVLVDNTTFEGQTVKARARATFVLTKKGLDWLIMHEHLSRIPEEYEKR